MAVAHYNVPTVRNSHLFVRTRARLQRTSDMKFFNGWIESINQIQASVHLKGPKTVVVPGEWFCVEVAGKEDTAAFFAEVVGVEGQVIDLAIDRGVTLMPKKENARVRLFREDCRICFEGAEYTGSAVDMSENGLAVVLSSALEPGTTVEFDLSAPFGSVSGTGKVLYCCTDLDAPGQLRAGIQVEGLDRISQARWNMLLNTTSAPR